ncbi:MAG: hypothetical protein MK110_16400 [Fuerstiella sp.]|nr:hypothetical protein [Fuerstiella sp.]
MTRHERTVDLQVESSTKFMSSIRQLKADKTDGQLPGITGLNLKRERRGTAAVRQALLITKN